MSVQSLSLLEQHFYPCLIPLAHEMYVKNSDEFVQKIYGPFDENKFNRKLKELKTSDLEFNQNYPEDPVNSNVSY